MKIDVIDLSKKFKNISVLNNINLTMESGNIYGLYGKNGSGKSVFLKLICGFYFPTTGKILFDGKELNKELDYPPSLRALIEKPSFFPDLTGLENLKLLADIQNKISNDDIKRALEIVNLSEDKDKKYSKYSLGMKQKLGIAQVIMEDVEIIILDEPFNGIEDETVTKIMEYLKKERDKGKIIIISSHIKEDLLFLSNKIFYFDNGTIYEK